MTEQLAARVLRLVTESPGIRLGAALDAVCDFGGLPDTSAALLRLIRSGAVELDAERRLYPKESEVLHDNLDDRSVSARPDVHSEELDRG